MTALRKCLLAHLLLVGCATETLPPADDNSPPVADAGPNLTAQVGDLVQVDASASSDPDGDQLTYTWAMAAPTGSAAALSNSTYANPSFLPDIPGDYLLVLTVNDGLVDSAPSDVVVTVTASDDTTNTAPVAVATGPASTVVGTTVSLDGTGSSDDDGDPITFDWLLEGRPDGSAAALSDASSPTPSFVPDVPGAYELSLVVRDSEAASRPAPLTIVASPLPNLPPTADAGPDRAVATSDTVTLDGTGSTDPENDALSYAWRLTAFPAGSRARVTADQTATPSITPDVDGTYTVELVVSDGDHTSAPDTTTVTAVTGNVPPNANAGRDVTAETGLRVVLDGTGSYDPEGQSLTYRWTITGQPMNSNVQLADPLTSAPSFTPSAVGTFEIELIVNDGEVDSAPDRVLVTTVSPNGAPIANAGPDLEARVLDTVALDGSASSDPDADPLSFDWSFTTRPANSAAVLQNSRGAVATFQPDLPGMYVATLTVRDGGRESSASATIAVLSPLPQVEGDVVISEVMSDPSTLTDPVGEWFELYNPTASAWDLKGCELTDFGGDYARIDTSLVVPPLSYVTLARSANPGFGPDYVYGGFVLGNSGDEIILTCDGSEISNVLFLTPAPTGASLSLMRAHLDEIANDDDANWCVASTDYNGDKGTPGAPNERLDTCL